MKLSLVNLITDSVYLHLTPNALLHIAVCSAQDALLVIASIGEARHTYKGRDQDKWGYACLTPNALLLITVSSAQNTLLGTASLHEAGHTYTG